ncbi:MAG: hypothetical protein JO067_01065 [Cupriavidus sp.]|nr:hypothetical protein [Cupriavidus sp.]
MTSPLLALATSAYKLNGPDHLTALMPHLPAAKGPEAPFSHDAANVLGRRVRHASAATRFLFSTASTLAETAGMQKLLTQNPDRAGVYVAGETIGLGEDLDFDLCVKVHGPDRVSPLKTPNTVSNVAGGQFAILTGIKGPNCTVASGEGSGIAALQLAGLALANARIDAAIVSGIEVSSRYHAMVFPGMRESVAAHLLVRAEDSSRVVFALPWIGMLDTDAGSDAICAAIGAQLPDSVAPDVVLLAWGAPQVEQTALKAALLARGWDATVVDGAEYYGTGEACSGLLALGMAQEWMTGAAPPGRKDKPSPRTIALVGVDQDNQGTVLVMRATS